MTIYQEEMRRKAYQHQCGASYDESTGYLRISYGEQHLADVDQRGYLHYHDRDLTDEDIQDVFRSLLDEASEVREYVGAYEAAPQMKPKDVCNYRKLAEFRDTVLAAMYSQAHGFMFCSWKQNSTGTSVAHGDYSQNYGYSKETFALRSGLVQKEKIFNLEESTDLHKCIQYARDYCGSLTGEEERNLCYLEEKLWDAYPQLEESRPTFDEEEGMQFNM